MAAPVRILAFAGSTRRQSYNKALVAIAASASAQQRDTTGRRFPQGTVPLTPNRDVILEVPELAVDSIGLTVQNVRAHVALDANAMNLVTSLAQRLHYSGKVARMQRAQFEQWKDAHLPTHASQLRYGLDVK